MQSAQEIVTELDKMDWINRASKKEIGCYKAGETRANKSKVKRLKAKASNE